LGRLGLGPLRSPWLGFYIDVHATPGKVVNTDPGREGLGPDEIAYDPEVHGKNAFSSGNSLDASATIAVGERWLDKSPRALAALIAHELAHIVFGDHRVLRRLAAFQHFAQPLALAALAPAIVLLSWQAAFYALPVLALVAAANLFRLAHSRQVEFRADAF